MSLTESGRERKCTVFFYAGKRGELLTRAGGGGREGRGLEIEFTRKRKIYRSLVFSVTTPPDEEYSTLCPRRCQDSNLKPMNWRDAVVSMKPGSGTKGLDETHESRATWEHRGRGEGGASVLLKEVVEEVLDEWEESVGDRLLEDRFPAIYPEISPEVCIQDGEVGATAFLRSVDRAERGEIRGKYPGQVVIARFKRLTSCLQRSGTRARDLLLRHDYQSRSNHSQFFCIPSDLRSKMDSVVLRTFL